MHDPGDLDFAARYRERGLGANLPLEQHHTSMDKYREWEESGMAINFATWAHDHGAQHEDGASEGAPQDGKHTANGHAKTDAAAVPQIVNGPLIGCGLELIHDAVARAVDAGRFALTLGGDHSVAAGSISALCSAYPRLGVIWVRAALRPSLPILVAPTPRCRRQAKQ